MNVDTMINMIKHKWTLSGYGTQLSDSDAKAYLIDAVYQVEGIDCPTSTSFTVDNGDITFDNGEPDDNVSMAYVFCALSQLQKAYMHGLLEDGEIGVTIKSNMESVSSSASTKLHSGITDNFDNQYKNILNKLKLSRLTSSPLIKIYQDSDYES